MDSARFQFQRRGFFVVDVDSTEAKPVMNRIVTLKVDKDLKKKKN